MQTRALFLHLSDGDGDKCLHQRSTCMVGKNGWVGLLVPNNAISSPKLANFWFIHLGLDRLSILLVFTFQLLQPLWDHIIIMRLQIILSSLSYYITFIHIIP